MGHTTIERNEMIRRGQEIYERQLRETVEPGNIGKILIVDIETGHYEIDDDHLAGTRRALAEHPGAVLYSLRIGYPTLGKLGGGWSLPRV